MNHASPNVVKPYGKSDRGAGGKSNVLKNVWVPGSGVVEATEPDSTTFREGSGLLFVVIGVRGLVAVLEANRPGDTVFDDLHVAERQFKQPKDAKTLHDNYNNHSLRNFLDEAAIVLAADSNCQSSFPGGHKIKPLTHRNSS